MNSHAGSHDFVKESSAHVVKHLSENTQAVRDAIVAATGAASDNEIERHRAELLASLTEVRDKAAREEPQPYTHYASRFDVVGLYQSVLSKVFRDMPDLQGYGDGNISWVTTPFEAFAHTLGNVLQDVKAAATGKTTPLQAMVKAWKDMKSAKAQYPSGVPSTLPLDDDCIVALLADWGGDNPAAKRIAEIVKSSKPKLAVHLGDIYYGGVKEECEAFLRNWPLQIDPSHPGNGVPAGSSLALNGNHEMYSGGESFFKIVLPAFGQLQPFFCLENAHWRLIGLDTAYLGGRLKPIDPGDPLWAQWNWLVDLLKNGEKRATILLTHHQPVSAHAEEYSDSSVLRTDVESLLDMEGIGRDAIFGWFFGHEHRCTVYKDTATPYNSRLIGSGCIPHVIQHEEKEDPGCTPFEWVSGRGEDGSIVSAVSQFALLHFVRESLYISLVDENNIELGHEVWNATKGKLSGIPFVPDGTTFLTR